ncbi:MAG: Wzz/FepE/Etk N-terminal domain-containing protein [Paludibacteraceae bacterium]|nr:Wzz/FepE/Etk N-terminal domain-containing protein [Paludibacteraceae bacterium]
MEEVRDNKQDQIDIVWLLKYLFTKRKFILKVVGCTTLFFVLICLFKPNKYTATASIIPVSSNTGVDLGGLNSLASMAGLTTGKSKSGVDIVTPDLYPKVAQSTPFLCEIMNIKVPWANIDTLMSVYEYTKYDSIPSFGEYLRMYTIDLPNTIKIWFNGKKTGPSINKKNLPYEVYDKYEYKAMSKLKEMIKVDEDPIFETIEVSVDAESPKQASILASSVVNTLQSHVIEHKTRRAKYMLDFIQERYNETTLEYESVRQKFFDYKDSHRDMISERVNVEYQRLSDQYDLSYSILKSISSQLEQAKLAFMENTPVFSIVQPVVLPVSKSGPKMMLYIVVGIMLGFITSIGWLIMRLAWWQVFDEERLNRLILEHK